MNTITSTNTKEMAINGLIFIAIFSILFLGTIGIGILSIRNFTALILLFIAINNANKLKLDKYQKLYILYILFLIISNIFNGQITDYKFIQNLISYHFVSIIIIISIPIVINSYERLKKCIIFLTILFLFNCIISILQYYNISIGWKIATTLIPQHYYKYNFLST